MEQPNETANVAEINQSTAIALPATVEDLIAQRKSQTQKTLNDQVETIHLALWPDDQYRAFLDAVHKEQAVEGDLYVDDVMAAQLIRGKAREMGNGYVAKQNLATIRKSMQVVLRRFGIGRRERRES